MGHGCWVTGAAQLYNSENVRFTSHFGFGNAELTDGWNNVHCLQTCCCLKDVFRKLFTPESNEKKKNFSAERPAERIKPH